MGAMKLTREQIVAEAIALLNEGGLSEVSLRRVAERVSARAPSLAPHVGDKEQLLTLMAQQIFDDCLASVPPCPTWQEQLREFGLALWRGQSQTRDAARLIAAAAPDRAQLQRTTEELVGPLLKLGLSREDAIWMQAAVQALVTGWTTFSQGADAANLSETLSLEDAFEKSLRSLVSGFEH
jgi:TetR/AcrR family tetracycline transcriptional repressor